MAEGTDREVTYVVLRAEEQATYTTVGENIVAKSPEEAIRIAVFAALQADQASGEEPDKPVGDHYIAVASRNWMRRPVARQMVLLVGDEIDRGRLPVARS